MKNFERTISIFLTTIMLLSQSLTTVAYAVQPNTPIPESTTKLTPLQMAVRKLSTQPNLPQSVLGIADSSRAQTSAHKRLPLNIQRMGKHDYKANEDVTLAVNNPDNETFTTKVVDATGKEQPIAVHTASDGTTTQIQLDATNQFTPGKYTIEVTDQTGQTTKQDFTWGVLALNPDKSIYRTNEKADIAMAVLDDKGEMVCDATLTLAITKPDGSLDTLQTSDGKIVVNPDCTSKKFMLTPDYETKYDVGQAGTYALKLTAISPNGVYTITDSLIVSDQVAFDVKRTGATRIYPPLEYPVTMDITANQDFNGTVTETVPASFTITPSDEANSYDKMNTLYINQQKDPANKLSQQVLGASTSSLVMPFDGTFPITQGFGTELTDLGLRNFYAQYGLGGHDGIDFGLPMGTPLYAVDDGNILEAGPGDYGNTIIIQHSWGRTYYGHLSEVKVGVNTSVSKGSLIGYSGNTGESTGPHLHFGMKPNNPDMSNGFAGKIDPLAYLPIGGANPAKALSLSNAEAVLGASSSADKSTSEQQRSLTAPAVTPELMPSETAPPTSSPAGTTVSLPSVQAAVEKYTVQDDEIRRDVASSESPQIEKVKVITWNVSLKKGDTKTLSYTYKAPQVSPQFYTVGPLKFFDSATKRVVFQETRSWQIAADAVGVDWYNRNWQYRKQITVNHGKVGGGTADAWCNDTTGVTCTTSWSARRKITINNSASGTNLVNFPLLVKVDSTRIDYAKTQSSGQDIRFVDPSDNTTVLPHEIETWNEAGSSYVWVKIPQLDAGSTTDYIWMYYGNAGASDGQQATSVWDSNFKAVYHMQNNPASTCSGTSEICDSTSNNNDGDNTGAATSGTGQIGNGYSFNGSSNYLDVPFSASLQATTNMTFSAWVKFIGQSSGGDSYSTIIEKGNSDVSDSYGMHLHASDTDEQTFEFDNPSSTIHDIEQTSGTMLTRNTWQLVTMVYDDTNNIFRAYLNGTQVYSVATALSLNTGFGDDLFIGKQNKATVTNLYKGTMDEVRINGTARSADWIKAEYLTSTDAMNSFGSEQSQSVVAITNYPVLINLSSDTSLKAHAQSTGNDILFTDSTGRTKLSHEIETYTTATGALVAWVKIPTLSSTTDTDIYMYYGNPSASSQQDAINVWDSNNKAVWHLKENPAGTAPQMADSTSGASNGTSGGTMTAGQQIAGQIGGSLNFDGSNDDVQFANESTFDTLNAITLDTWVQIGWSGSAKTDGNQNGTIISKRSAFTTSGIPFEINYNGSAWAFRVIGTGGALTYAVAATIGNWYHVVGTWDGATETFYLNGVAVASQNFAGTLTDNNTAVRIGLLPGGTEAFDGQIDEVRVSNIARPTGWIDTEYNNESSPSTFYTLGNEEGPQFAPTNDKLMKHGMYFDSTGVRQPFVF